MSAAAQRPGGTTATIEPIPRGSDPPLATEVPTDATGPGPAWVPVSEGLEARLVQCIDAGTPRQFITLCATHYGPALGRLCMAMLGTQGEAEELVQETLIAAFGSLDAFEARSSVKAWLFGIARKKCLKQLEQRAMSERKLTVVGDTRIDASQLPDAQLQLRQRSEQARQLLYRLRPTDREALMLRFVADLSYSQVARASGVEETTARKRVSRALARLRELSANGESR